MPLWNVDSCLVVTRICFASLDQHCLSQSSIQSGWNLSAQAMLTFWTTRTFITLFAVNFKYLPAVRHASVESLTVPHWPEPYARISNLPLRSKIQHNDASKNIQKYARMIKMTEHDPEASWLEFPANVVSASSSVLCVLVIIASEIDNCTSKSCAPRISGKKTWIAAMLWGSQPKVGTRNLRNGGFSRPLDFCWHEFVDTLRVRASVCEYNVVISNSVCMYIYIASKLDSKMFPNKTHDNSLQLTKKI